MSTKVTTRTPLYHGAALGQRTHVALPERDT
jgi:hypothetical protein